MPRTDDDRRVALARRLIELLDSNGYDHWEPSEGKVRGDDQTQVSLSYLEVCEIAGALYDAAMIHDARHDAHGMRAFWERLRSASPEERNELLQAAGLGREGSKERTVHRRLNMARHYCSLTRHGHVDSPERERVFDPPPRERLFGERIRGAFESAKYKNLPGSAEPPPQPGETIYEIVSDVEAIHIIARWYGCKDAYAARDQLIEARRALKEHPGHPVVYHQFPPPYDSFEIPNEAKLSAYTEE